MDPRDLTPANDSAACANRTPQALPRAEWPTHPRYPSQLLLLGSHRNFRAVNDALRLHVMRGADLELTRRRWAQFIGAMRSHEAYEERKLYPYLARRWGVSFAEAEAGHEALHVADDAVRAAFHAQDRSAVIRALVEHGEVLAAHLELEEDAVIPLLLQLEPEEFERYTRTPASILMRDDAACVGGACG